MAEGLDLGERGRRVLEQIDNARKALQLYPPDHPTVSDVFRHLEYVLSDLFLGYSEVTIALVEREFYLQQFPLKRESTSFEALASFLEERDATSITFLPDLTTHDLRLTFAALNATPTDLSAQGGASAAVEAAGVRRIHIARARTSEERAPAAEKELPPEVQKRLDEARDQYESTVGEIQSVFDSVAMDGQVDYRTIKMATEALLDSVVTNRNVWTHLLNVKHTDEYSYNHSVNVTTLALLLATRFGVQRESLTVLGEAALLHDLGKQKVPAEILKKPAALTDDEWVVMRSHPEKGAKILLGVRDVSEAAIMVAYEHHIRYDHKGYPPPRQKRKLHLFSHLVAVADIYDALTSDRGYRRALVPDMAMRIILTQSGTAFHPLVVKHFVNLVGVYPVGTFIKLRTGEIGIVQHNQSRDLLRPIVVVMYDAAGAPLDPVTRDLLAERQAENADAPPVECCIDPAAFGLSVGTA